MAQELLEHLLDVQRLRPAVDQGEHDDADRLLQRRELVELVEHQLRVGVALEVEDQADGLALSGAALVAQGADALDALLLDERGDGLGQLLALLLVGHLLDDDLHRRGDRPKLRPGPPGWDVRYLHNAISRAVPVVAKPTPEAARYDFNWLSATGTGCFLAAIVSGLLLGVSPRHLLRIFWRTLVRMRLAMVAISFMLGLGYVTRYSGLDAVLGLAFTRTGWLYPFFGTFLGWLGVALTGSDTSANALFGSLQRITSQQLSIDAILMCAANSAGGVMGKMVDAQSITIATAATEQVGNEGIIFRFVAWHSVALCSIVGVIVLLYAYVFRSAVPHGLLFVK